MNASKLVFSEDGDTFKVISVDNQQDVLENHPVCFLPKLLHNVEKNP